LLFQGGNIQPGASEKVPHPAVPIDNFTHFDIIRSQGEAWAAMSFIAELRRRNVLRVGAAYVAGAWLLIQVAQTLFPVFGLGDTAVRGVIVVLAIGLVPLLIFAWAFELTPEGLKRESEVDRSESITPQTGKKLDRVIMVVLALALGYFAFDKFVLAPQREEAVAEAARKEGRTESLVKSYGDKSIAVLPFVNMSADKDQEYFSDGISEELLNLLAKIPELRVISRSSAFSYKGKDVKLAQVARELNVAHILEGSVRKAGNKIRITAQLIEARSDTHLWSETWDRNLDDIFAIQDEISAAVVARLRVTLLDQPPRPRELDPEAYALYLQARHLGRQSTAEDFLIQCIV
jgi:TolB-like protein